MKLFGSCVLREIGFCRCLKIFLNQIAGILELVAIATLKWKITDGNMRGNSAFLIIKVNKKSWGVPM